MKFLSALLFLLWKSSTTCSAQEIDIETVNHILVTLENSLPKDTKVYLNRSVYSSLVRKSNINTFYKTELERFISAAKIDSIILESERLANFFLWKGDFETIEILDSDSFKNVFESNTIPILKKKKFLFLTYYVEKRGKRDGIYIKTSAPIVSGNYCVVRVSILTGNTSALECIYVYYSPDNRSWQCIGKVDCRIG